MYVNTLATLERSRAQTHSRRVRNETNEGKTISGQRNLHKIADETKTPKGMKMFFTLRFGPDFLCAPQQDRCDAIRNLKKVSFSARHSRCGESLGKLSLSRD